MTGSCCYRSRCAVLFIVLCLVQISVSKCHEASSSISTASQFLSDQRLSALSHRRTAAPLATLSRIRERSDNSWHTRTAVSWEQGHRQEEPNKTVVQVIRGGASAADIASTAAAGGSRPYGIPLIGWKIIFQCSLTIVNILAWMIPLRSRKISDDKFVLSMMNNFSAGVFLSMAFGHLIPEAVLGFAKSETFGGNESNKLVAYWMVLAGYMIIFFVEKVAFDAHALIQDLGGSSVDREHREVSAAAGSEGLNPAHRASALILLGALSVHSILEMSALGLASSFRDCTLMTLSIGLHQPAESIALLVAFLKTGMSKRRIARFLSFFAFMDVVGVAIGMAVNEFAPPIVDAIMVAVVAGTFVYVGATELIPEEWEEPDQKWKKFVALLSGIGVLYYVTRYTTSLAH